MILLLVFILWSVGVGAGVLLVVVVVSGVGRVGVVVGLFEAVDGAIEVIHFGSSVVIVIA